MVFDGLDLRIDKGDRTVFSANGAKSLARVLAGVEPFQEGEETWSEYVIGYLLSIRPELNPNNEVLSEVEEVCANPYMNPGSTELCFQRQ